MFTLASGTASGTGWTDGPPRLDPTSDHRLDRLVGGLFDLGVFVGAAVGILMEHSERRVEACLAVWQAGAAQVPLDVHFDRQSIEAIVSDADLHLIVVDDHYLDLGRDIVEHCAPCCPLSHHGRRHEPGRNVVPWEEIALGQPYRPDVAMETVAIVTYSVRNARPDGIPYTRGALVQGTVPSPGTANESSSPGMTGTRHAGRLEYE